MKKFVICNIAVRSDATATKIESNDKSMPVSDEKYIYPINSMFSQTVCDGDEIEADLIVKDDGSSTWEGNVQKYKDELERACAGKKVSIRYNLIKTDFVEERDVHEDLIRKVVGSIPTGVDIYDDMTFGPKDVAIINFMILNFAEKFLQCNIKKIVYNRVIFVDNKPDSSLICDMSPLYYLSSLTNTIHCDDPEKARKILNSLLSM